MFPVHCKRFDISYYIGVKYKTLMEGKYMLAMYPLYSNKEVKVSPNWFEAERMDYVAKSDTQKPSLIEFIKHLFH